MKTETKSLFKIWLHCRSACLTSKNLYISGKLVNRIIVIAPPAESTRKDV